MLSLKNKRVAVLGLMDAGIAAVRFLHHQGAKVKGYGLATELELNNARESLKGVSADLETAEQSHGFLQDYELVVTTPGAKRYEVALESYQKKGGQVFSDLELACQFYKKPLIAVTGTNGKSTVMLMVEHLLKAGGKKVLLVGGDYTDFGDSLLVKTPYDYLLTELSSARLQTTRNFHPHIAVFLNLYPGHAERHRSLEEYGDAKAKIFAQQDESDFLIHQASPEVEAAIQRVECRAKRIPFSLSQPQKPGLFFNFPEKKIFLVEEVGSYITFFTEKFPLAGPHKVENLMAAIAVAKLCGVMDAKLQEAIETMPPIPHRMELLKKIGGVGYYNDAKAANMMATLYSLQSFPDEKVVLIAGGEYMSQQFYKTLNPFLQKKVKCLIIFGMYRERFFKHWGEATDTYLVETLEDAVQLAAQKAEKGDSVLFSPASRPERHVHMSAPRRGEAFKKAVESLKELSKARGYFPQRF